MIIFFLDNAFVFVFRMKPSLSVQCSVSLTCMLVFTLCGLVWTSSRSVVFIYFFFNLYFKYDHLMLYSVVWCLSIAGGPWHETFRKLWLGRCVCPLANSLQMEHLESKCYDQSLYFTCCKQNWMHTLDRRAKEDSIHSIHSVNVKATLSSAEPMRKSYKLLKKFTLIFEISML